MTERSVEAIRHAKLLRSGAHGFRDGERLVGAVEEFDGHEDHLLVADIRQVVDLEPAGSVGLVPGLARLIAVFDGGAIMDCWRPRPPVTQVQK